MTNPTPTLPDIREGESGSSLARGGGWEGVAWQLRDLKIIPSLLNPLFLTFHSMAVTVTTPPHETHLVQSVAPPLAIVSGALPL